MTDGEELIVKELQQMRSLLEQLVESVGEIQLETQAGFSEVLGWTAYPYLTEIQNPIDTNS